MQLELIKKDSITIGWKLIAENEEERLKMGSIRNMSFFGMGGNVPAYAGMRSWPEDSRYVQELQWKQKKHHEDYEHHWERWKEEEEEAKAWWDGQQNKKEE